MKKQEEYDEAELVNNPFIANLTIPVSRITNYKEFRLGPDGINLPVSFFLDRTPSTKIYHGENRLKKLADISDRAVRMVMYMMMTIENGKHFIRLNEDRYRKMFDIRSPNTYKDTIKELVTAAYIARTNYKTVFWINPDLFFSGDRTKAFPDKLDQKSERDISK